MIKEAINNLISGKSLTIKEASLVMEEIMEGNATQAQLGAFLVALRLKGETSEEVAGMASMMRSKSTCVNVHGPVIDIVGTGGDGSNTFNISTTAAFVMAGTGLKVAKHGNRAMSSHCGSADVLEALGIQIGLEADKVVECIDEVGIGFMFAQTFHPSMKYAAGARKEIGIRTVFNILGPLTNPARAQYQVIGVPNMETGDKIALALCYMGIKRAMVVYGCNGIDELSISGESAVWEIRDNKVISSQQYLHPEDFNLGRSPSASLLGGTPVENADILRAVLKGEKSPRRDVVLLNAAAGIVTGGKANNMSEAIELAGESIDSGKALDKLTQLVQFTDKVSVTGR
jgi:anthranilate phosphoribosyltransferase